MIACTKFARHNRVGPTRASKWIKSWESHLPSSLTYSFRHVYSDACFGRSLGHEPPPHPPLFSSRTHSQVFNFTCNFLALFASHFPFVSKSLCNFPSLVLLLTNLRSRKISSFCCSLQFSAVRSSFVTCYIPFVFSDVRSSLLTCNYAVWVFCTSIIVTCYYAVPSFSYYCCCLVI